MKCDGGKNTGGGGDGALETEFYQTFYYVSFLPNHRELGLGSHRSSSKIL